MKKIKKRNLLSNLLNENVMICKTSIISDYSYARRIVDRAIPDRIAPNPHYRTKGKPMKLFRTINIESGNFYLQPLHIVNEGEQITYTYNEEKVRGYVK